MERSLEAELKKWKESALRYPILLRGARQVGKTYLIEKFGQREFSSVASVNFEAQPEAIACFDTLDPVQILIRLEMVLKKPITPGKTLLFLDEIQACPQAIVALRYFKEKLPQLHVIGAGSLLELAFIRGKFSFPVGRVQFLYLKPLSFKEYAKARGKADLFQELDSCTFEKPPRLELHNEMTGLVKEYCLVGGMPAAVSTFCETFSLQNSLQVQEILLSTYRADFSKYATEAEQKYLKILFEGIPPTIGQQFKYSKIDPHIHSRELKGALDQLEWAGLILPIFSSSASRFPLAAQIKHFKLLYLDIGLAQRSLRIDPELVLKKELTGALAEQFVGQEIAAYQESHIQEPLYYWQREKQGSDAEVDYLVTVNGEIIPIEVKSGLQGNLKSLYQFMQEKNSKIGVRVSQSPLLIKERILSVPFYLIEQLPRLVDRLLKTH